MPEPVLEQTLEQIISSTKDGRRDYENITRMVQAVLFSVFPERRIGARQQLKHYWPGAPVTIETEEDERLIYAYVKFKGIVPYIFLQKYSKDEPVQEEVPTTEEMSKWPAITQKPY